MIKYLDILEVIRDKNVELRHDVDVSLDSAYNIALIEKEISIKSTYYLRFDSDYYNVLSDKNKKIIDFLILNHEIGCHVDVSNINNESDLIGYLDRFNDIYPFKKYTFHINTNKTMSFSNTEKYINKSIIKHGYLSDSKGIFNDEKYKFIQENDNFTLVLHPEWWDNFEFTFTKNPDDTIIDSLNFKKVIKKVLKEILNIEI
jgi:hypothetical protein